MNRSFDHYEPVLISEKDKEGKVVRAEEFKLPSKEELVQGLDAAEVKAMVDSLSGHKEKENFVRHYLANKKMIESLQSISDLAYRELSVAQTAAIAGKQLHATLTDIVWDGLQLLGQHDVTI